MSRIYRFVFPWLVLVPSSCGPTAEKAACERLTGDGDVAWSMRCGGATNEAVQGVAVDAAGNIYVGIDLRVIDVSAAIRFGEFEVVPGEHSDILIVKFDPEGEAMWVKQVGGPDEQYLDLLRGCADGVVIAGQAPAGLLDLGGGSLPAGPFIASLDGNGAHRWSRSVPVLVEDGDLTVTDMVCDTTGSLVLAGAYSGGIDLGGGPLTAPVLNDGVVARYDGTGVPLWSHGFGSTGYGVFASGVAYTPKGEVVVIGSFDATVDLGGGPLSTFDDDVVVGLYGADGAHVWSRQFGPTGLQYGFAVAVDGAGQVAIGGDFWENIMIGAVNYVNYAPGQSPDIDGTLYDGFLGFLDATGAPGPSLQIGGTLGDHIDRLEFDADGVMVMTASIGTKLTLRAFVDGAPGWHWHTDEFQRAYTALTDDAVIVAASTSEEVNLGAGPMVPRGQDDLLLAKIRR